MFGCEGEPYALQGLGPSCMFGSLLLSSGEVYRSVPVPGQLLSLDRARAFASPSIARMSMRRLRRAAGIATMSMSCGTNGSALLGPARRRDAGRSSFAPR